MQGERPLPLEVAQRDDASRESTTWTATHRCFLPPAYRRQSKTVQINLLAVGLENEANYQDHRAQSDDEQVNASRSRFVTPNRELLSMALEQKDDRVVVKEMKADRRINTCRA